MKDFKKIKGDISTYSSFEELGKAFGCKPVVKQTKDKEKLKQQRENFCNRNRCKVCGQSMIYVGYGMMACVNEKCSGIETKDENFESVYSAVYKYLDEKGIERISLSLDSYTEKQIEWFKNKNSISIRCLGKRSVLIDTPPIEKGE